MRNIVKKTNNKPYLDKPKKKEKMTKEQLLYGNSTDLSEKEKKDKLYKELNLNEWGPC